jgi:hypothetical protein
VNVPIRTVLLTRLSKYSGEKVATLTARDFHQITGRAGRRGFDDVGYVVCQAPEHIIENAKMEAKAAGDVKKLRKMVKKKPPEGFVGWNEDTFKKLQAPRRSRCVAFPSVARHAAPGAEPPWRRLRGHAAAHRRLARDGEREDAAREARVAAFSGAGAAQDRRDHPHRAARADGTKLRLNVELQDDFSLNYTLSLYLIDTLALIDPRLARPTRRM